jgi:hypothetical protein
MRAKEFVIEYRDRMFQYIKSVLPKWPDYVLKDWIYFLARGDHQAGVYYKPDNSNDKYGFNKETILKMVRDTGLSPDTKWQFVPNMKFTMEMWTPEFQKLFSERIRDVSIGKTDSDRDTQRHATQSNLAGKEGGVRKEPVLLLKHPNGYTLLEGWHRTTQHFLKYPDGYTGPAYVAVANNVTEEKIVESAYEEAWELISQPVPEIQKFVKDLGLLQNKQSAEKISPLIDAVVEKEIPASSIPKLKNLANKGNDAQTLQSIIKISGQPNAAEQYVKLMKARDAGEKRNRGYDVSGLVNSIKSGNYEAPVLLQLPTGLYVIGGRTRLYAALALNVPAKVKIISADTFKQKLDEVPLPPDWDLEKLNLRQTFKDRLKYALERAKRLGGGSSRVAMTIDYEGRPTVLKVAKNLKGLAQNEAEIDILKDGYIRQLPIVIPLIDYDKSNARPVWLQTEVAKKIQSPTLLKLLHAPNYWLLSNKIRNTLGQKKPLDMTDEGIKKQYFETHNDRWKPTEEDWDIFVEYADELATLVDASGLSTGDLLAANNWGVYNGRPVVIDLGLTQNVWDQYYTKKDKAQ